MTVSKDAAKSVICGALTSAILSTVLILVARSVVRAASPPDCERLVTFTRDTVTITKAEAVPAGSYTTQYGLVLTEMPPFCRVVGRSSPTDDSNIGFEIWLPLSHWNGRFRAIGNGGYSGNIAGATLTMALALRHGYATSSTDRGHQSRSGLDGSFALGHPEKVIDVAYRGDHVTALAAKAMMRAFYGREPRYSYYEGCSGGGYEGIQAASRHPNDYDGVLYGAPGINWVGVSASYIWESQATLNDPASYLPSSKLPMISEAVVAACDALDGVRDGIVDDPRRCHFDPALLQCRGSDASTCLTEPQVNAVKKLYAGVHNSRTGELIYPGLEPSSEFGWSPIIAGPRPFFGDEFFKYFVFENPNWDFHTMNFDSDPAYANRKWGAVMNVAPDLTAFQEHRGKIIGYQGWIDPFVNPQNIVSFHEVVQQNGRKHQPNRDFAQLYMVPGMGHCAGGPGPNSFGAPIVSAKVGASESLDPRRNIMYALEHWVEDGTMPTKIIATKYGNDDPTQVALRSRPLCPYPLVAKWTGGNTDEASNFICAAAANGGR